MCEFCTCATSPRFALYWLIPSVETVLRARHATLLAGLHVLQRILAGGDLVVAQDQRIPRAQLIGQFHGALQLPPAITSTEMPSRRRSRASTPAWRSAASPSGAMKRSSAGVARLLHGHHQPVFADRKPDPRRMHARAQRFRQAIVTPAAQHGILRAQIAVRHFERGAHVVIEPAHQARLHFELECRGRSDSASLRRSAAGRSRTGYRESTAVGRSRAGLPELCNRARAEDWSPRAAGNPSHSVRRHRLQRLPQLLHKQRAAILVSRPN